MSQFLPFENIMTHGWCWLKFVKVSRRHVEQGYCRLSALLDARMLLEGQLWVEVVCYFLFSETGQRLEVLTQGYPCRASLCNCRGGWDCLLGSRFNALYCLLSLVSWKFTKPDLHSTRSSLECRDLSSRTHGSHFPQPTKVVRHGRKPGVWTYKDRGRKIYPRGERFSHAVLWIFYSGKSSMESTSLSCEKCKSKPTGNSSWLNGGCGLELVLEAEARARK